MRQCQFAVCCQVLPSFLPSFLSFFLSFFSCLCVYVFVCRWLSGFGGALTRHRLLLHPTTHGV